MIIPTINKDGHSGMEGFPPPPQESAPLNQFYIGEDVFFQGFLQMDGKPVSLQDWEPSVVVTSNPYATKHVWEGVLNNGIYMSNSKPGDYEILIPAETFTVLAPGTFWLTIFLKEQMARFNRVKDRRAIAARIPFSMDMSGVAPSAIDTRRDSERTYPFPVNMMKV